MYISGKPCTRANHVTVVTTIRLNNLLCHAELIAVCQLIQHEVNYVSYNYIAMKIEMCNGITNYTINYVVNYMYTFTVKTYSDICGR